jgi:single-strand DNA-binding protein
MTNNISLVGRLTKDPQSREVGEHTVVSFSVACDNKGKDKGTSYFDCQSWNKQGEFVMNYLSKGRLVYVNGHMESRKHEDKTYWTLNAESIRGLDRPKQEDDAPSKPATEDYNPLEDED